MERKEKKKAKARKRIINLSSVKRTVTVVLETRERIGKVRVEVVMTRQITLGHWIYIWSWKLITTKAECIGRDNFQRCVNQSML